MEVNNSKSFSEAPHVKGSSKSHTSLEALDLLFLPEVDKARERPIIGPIPLLPPAPDPQENPEQLINSLIEQAKLVASGKRPPLTGRELDLLFKALEQGKPADVNGTGPTDIKDLLMVYERGKFAPVGHDGGPPSGENPKALKKIKELGQFLIDFFMNRRIEILIYPSPSQKAFQELVKALEKFTGIKDDGTRAKALWMFFRGLATGGKLDPNGDSQINYKDIIKLWKDPVNVLPKPGPIPRPQPEPVPDPKPQPRIVPFRGPSVKGGGGSEPEAIIEPVPQPVEVAPKPNVEPIYTTE